MTFTGTLHPYQVQDTQRMLDRKRMLVAYGQGCLTGDTLVTVNRRGKGFSLRLDELVRRWTEGAAGRWPGSHHKRYADGETYVRALLADGSLGRAQLVGVKDTGPREVFCLTLSDGSSIKATAGHEIVTTVGKVPLSNLRPGDGVLTESLGKASQYPTAPTGGWTLPDGRRTDKRGYVRLYGTSHPHRAADGGVFEHHLVAEEILGRWLAPGEEVHHRNGVRHDNDPGNLQVVTRKEHLALHNFRPNLAGVRPNVASVVSVEHAGVQRVYDLSVADDAHTWVGNGIVVGNTGKTVMTISVIERLFDSRAITEPGLIVALSGLKYQWADAIARFTCVLCGGSKDTDECTHQATSTSLVIDGTADKRAAQYARAYDYDYVILNYEQCVNDWTHVQHLPRGFMILDEASFIRGPAAARAKQIKQMDSEYKYGLTGTPIENGRPEEIFSIMEWVDPEVLGKPSRFDSTFIVRDGNGRVKRYRNIPLFVRTLQDAMVRRTEEDPEVAPYMPKRAKVGPLLVDLDEPNRAAYLLIARDLIQDLEEAATQVGAGFSLDAHYGGWGNGTSKADAIRGRIGQKILALQFLCNHPDLIRRSAAKHAAGTGGSGYCAALVDSGALDGVATSPKLDRTIEYVSQHLDADPQSKFVIFTVYIDMVDLLGQALPYGWRPFTGKQNARTKQENKVAFQQDPDVRVLVSSDAGGYGVDLPQANHLLNYDLPDKAGTADQRDTRIVRASSTFAEVSIRPILVRGSLEERKYASLQQKKNVAGAFLDGRRINAKGGVDLDLDTLTNFLKSTSP